MYSYSSFELELIDGYSSFQLELLHRHSSLNKIGTVTGLSVTHSYTHPHPCFVSN
jgi:hypothetical protein